MSSTAKTVELKLLPDSKAPLILRASQGRLYGTLNLRNTGDNQISAKSISIQAQDILKIDNTELNILHLRGRVPARDQRQVRVEYQINPTTPPGIYKAKLQLGDEEQAAEIHVEKNVELDITPAEVILQRTENPQLSQEFQFTNTGNVDIHLADKFIIPIKSDAMLETALQRGIESLTSSRSKKEPQLSDVLQAIGKQLAGPMTLSWRKLSIKPGETKTIKTKIELPDNLQPNSRYYSELELYSGSVLIEIYT
jgi:hypothetical protein